MKLKDVKEGQKFRVPNSSRDVTWTRTAEEEQYMGGVEQGDVRWYIRVVSDTEVELISPDTEQQTVPVLGTTDKEGYTVVGLNKARTIREHNSPDIVEEHEESVTDKYPGYKAFMKSREKLSQKGKELNKENIEALGWIWSERNGWFEAQEQLWLMTVGYAEQVWVNVWSDENEYGQYQGYLPDIAALRQLMLWLGINTDTDGILGT